jgi:threonine dehydrogenase-like Zn-dependent dehydrogenase
MKALVWHGKGTMRCDTVPDPRIEHPRDAIIKVTACAICGSDLHIYDGMIPTMKHGDVLGHETMGEVVEVGAETKKLKVGDRVVVPFTIACGECFFCQRGFFSGCERSNPNHEIAEKVWGHSPAGLFGYSHMLGGYSGGQAEYLRVPFADVGPIKVPDGLTDEQVHFCLIFSRPVTWPRISVTSRAETRSLSGAVGRSVNSRFAAPSCWVQSA